MIFCVEDDPNIRELEVYTLKSTGFPALGLESGDELFKALETVLPQLIILDIMLPGEDGMAILKRLRRDKRTADIPVIMATAKGSEFDKVHGLDSGADDYIAKPFGMMEMVSRVKAVLRRYVKEDKSSELTNGLITMDIARHMVFVNGEEVVTGSAVLTAIAEQGKFAVPQVSIASTFWDPNANLGNKLIADETDPSNADFFKQLLTDTIANVRDE